MSILVCPISSPIKEILIERSRNETLAAGSMLGAPAPYSAL
jgi:hypothetical protein